MRDVRERLGSVAAKVCVTLLATACAVSIVEPPTIDLIGKNSAQVRWTTDRPGKFVDTAIPALIEEMEKLAGGKLNLIAKVAGGANMFTTTVAASIGLQNIESCEQLLAELRIPIVARHCGGAQGRRMSLNTADGNVMIEIVGRDPIEL